MIRAIQVALLAAASALIVWLGYLTWVHVWVGSFVEDTAEKEKFAWKVRGFVISIIATAVVAAFVLIRLQRRLRRT